MRVTARPPTAALSPGERTTVILEVTNELSVIDGVTAALDAGPGLDVTVEPPLLALFPDSTGVLTLTVTPSPTFPAGHHDLVVEVRSSVEPSEAVRLPVAAEVAPVPRATLTAVPPLRSGRHRAQYSLVLDNAGNTPLDLSLAAIDTDRSLRTAFAPPALLVEPGGTSTAALAVRARHRLYGRVETHQVDLLASAPELELEARVGFAHRPLVPSGVRTLAILATIVAVWAAIFVVALTHAYSNDAPGKDVPPSFYAASPSAQTVSGKTALGSLGTFRFETAAAEGGVPAGAVPKSGVAIGIGGTVTGTVTATSTQSGIGRITVQAMRSTPQGPSLVSSAATADDGTYTLAGLLPGQYELRFSAAGYQDVWYPAASSQAQATPVTVDALSQTSGIDATVSGLPATITGTVVTGTTPQAPVTVTVLPQQGRSTTPIATVSTNAAGQYSIPDLPAPGTYDLSFTAAGFQVASDTEAVAGGEAHTANTIDLNAGAGTIGGTVTDGSGPLGGVTITATADGHTYTTATPTTGPVGTFTLANLPSPATYLLTFTDTGFGTQTLAEALGPGQVVTNLSVSMAGGAGQVTGVVTSASGQPLGNVTVTVDGGPSPVTTQSLTAGHVGAYSLSGLSTPGNYTLTFSLAGYVSETLGVTLVSNGSDGNVNASLPPAFGGIGGTVTASNGTPLAGVTVTATDGTITHTTMTTSSPAGGYSLADLTPGSWSVTFSQTGYTSQTALVTVTAGATATASVALAGA